MRTRIAFILSLALLFGPAFMAVAEESAAAAPAATAAADTGPAMAPAAAPAADSAAAMLASPAKAPGEAAPASGKVDFVSMLFVFMLASFIGIMVISRVSRLLHTPLMALTNAISAIAVVGSILITGAEHPTYITILGAVALFASMTNIVSGFLITNRMLKMFKTKEKGKS
jgi:H+-translocating NAD(P) transhydrogenase subunit alpha